MPIINMRLIAEKAYVTYKTMSGVISDGLDGRPEFPPFSDLSDDQQSVWVIIADVVIRNWTMMKDDTESSGG